MESGGEDTSERKVPKTLKEAYGLRDAAAPGEWDFYQVHVYRLRKEEYSRSWWKRVLGRWKWEGRSPWRPRQRGGLFGLR